MFPTVSIQADSTIFNGEYDFPMRGLYGEVAAALVNPCKLTLDPLGVALLFNKDSITTFVRDEVELRRGGYGWLDHLVNFVKYKSRVNYRLYANYFADDETSLETCKEVEGSLTFNLERLTGEQGIKKVGERYVSRGSEPHLLEIPRAEFDGFDKLIDTSLALAIAYFLLASENPTYFLVEHYKCAESIKRFFGGDRDMFAALEPHGFSKSSYEKLHKVANDQREPIGFGRHAPAKGVKVIGIDLRALHTPTMQRELFIKCAEICRSCIDAFVSYLRAQP